jgi:DNA-binding MarR family transcriptional regulator
MSSARLKQIPGIENIPYIGALLRLAHEEARSRVLRDLTERGLGDINQAHSRLFQYPPIDGMRPADLAKRLGISKQALNHLLGQLEKLRYLQRRSQQGNGHIAIYFTKRGWLVLESIIATMRQLEADWQRKLGKRRFAELKEALRELTGSLMDQPLRPTRRDGPDRS